MNIRIGEMERASHLLDQPEGAQPGVPLRVVGNLPRRYGITPTLGVDVDLGVDVAAAEAVLLIKAGFTVTVSNEKLAREVLAALGLAESLINSRIRFGQTGRL